VLEMAKFPRRAAKLFCYLLEAEPAGVSRGQVPVDVRKLISTERRLDFGFIGGASRRRTSEQEESTKAMITVSIKVRRRAVPGQATYPAEVWLWSA
jgi:hypothetical protein